MKHHYAHAGSQKQLGVEGAEADGKGLDGGDLCWIVVHDVGV